VVEHGVEGEETVKMKGIVKAKVKEKQEKNIVLSLSLSLSLSVTHTHTQLLAQMFHTCIL
jgi:hypothetical protein